MDIKKFFTIFGILFVVGCQTTGPKAPDFQALCPMPSGYQLEQAIDDAEITINNCPDTFDRVFMKLLEIAKHKPDIENKTLIIEMFKRLSAKNKISERYTKDLVKKYFSSKFVSLPDIKPQSLAVQIDTIKHQLRKELAFKKIGMVECGGDRVSFTKAETEYARVINFLEMLVLNEEYVKGLRG